MVERAASDSQYRLTKQFNPTGAADDLTIVMLYDEQTEASKPTDDGKVHTQYHALVRKEAPEMTENDI